MAGRVTIVGAGPAGLAAAIYLQRAGKSPLLLERGEPGGLLRSANLVENYPGFPGGVTGVDLAGRIRRQLAELGCPIKKAEARQIASHSKGFTTKTDIGAFDSQSVIVATGTRPKEVRIPGEGSIRRSIYDEITQVPRKPGRKSRALILGGGDAAFDYALNLESWGYRVAIVSRSGPSCLPLLRERAERKRIQVHAGSKSLSVEERGEDIVLSFISDGRRVELEGDWLLKALGRMPNMEVLGPALRRKIGALKDIPETAVPGLFLVGDVVRGSHRQTGIAVGDGVHAAMMANEYLEKGEA